MDQLRRQNAPDDSIPALLSRAVSEAQAVARAEIDLQKAKLVIKIGEARNGVVLGIGALVLVGMALIGLVVGLLLMLSAWIGPVWATVIVVGVLLVGAGVLGWLAARQFKLLFGAKE